MKRSHFVKAAIIVLLSLGSLGIVGGSFFLRKAFSSSSSEPGVITDTSQYQEIRQQFLSDNEHIQYFPPELPSGTQNVRIAYSNGVNQGSSYFQVRLKQSPEKIEKLLSQYRDLAKYQYLGGSTNDHANQPNGVPTTFFYTSDASAESFPASYEILVLDAQDQGKPGFKWHRGKSYGVAINTSASEIIYWSEKW
jgi:hypothetical protein